MKRVILLACAGVLAAAICGCSSQRIVSREWYEPTADTMREREDGERIGALKSETIKSGQPDWSGNKTFSLFSF
jgi:hypothetical protein